MELAMENGFDVLWLILTALCVLWVLNQCLQLLKGGTNELPQVPRLARRWWPLARRDGNWPHRVSVSQSVHNLILKGGSDGV